MTAENAGYTLSIADKKTNAVAEKVYKKPMSLYVPSVANASVVELVACILPSETCTLTMTNNNNGVSVDKSFETQALLKFPPMAAEAVKDLINIVRGYDEEDDQNVCGW
ncbi:DUF1869 domain-containing protein [Rahnella laticis]|uniref:DUF1869 domain-containing protein n=1 Tax=Rahnella laticis TaxID=2787622 RepID=UPI0018A29294|nr:DUF1869 domain-containing protein [Rahnella laticis]MBF7997462.1 DUF1869 domain-containing protein [Rahnella laticis]